MSAITLFINYEEQLKRRSKLMLKGYGVKRIAHDVSGEVLVDDYDLTHDIFREYDKVTDKAYEKAMKAVQNDPHNKEIITAWFHRGESALEWYFSRMDLWFVIKNGVLFRKRLNSDQLNL